MAVRNVKDELRKLDEEEARIKAQRDKLREQAKEEALAAINAAIEELNALGYNYRLTEAQGATRSASRASTIGRRSGVREQVLQTVSAAGPDGIDSAAVREQLGMTDKADSQAVSNALSALKRQSKISLNGGVYTAA